jgi:hypothetical protein
VVAEQEDDDLLRLFGHERERTRAAKRFWAEQVGTKEAMMAVQELEDYDEVVRRFLELLPPEKRMEGLAPEQRVAGLAPEQVVRALGTDELLPAMPDEVLRALSDEFIEKLPEPTRSAVRKRLGR